jgi:hypothetical protein
VPVQGKVFEKFKNSVRALGFVGDNQRSAITQGKTEVAVNKPITFIGKNIDHFYIIFA